MGILQHGRGGHEVAIRTLKSYFPTDIDALAREVSIAGSGYFTVLKWGLPENTQ